MAGVVVLDLGCGKGREGGFPARSKIIGLDLRFQSLKTARQHFPDRLFVHARAEQLPFADHSFDHISSEVAMPYMDMPQAVRECYRVLKPGGSLHASFHALRFTLSELRIAWPKPKALAFRLWVILNGFIFHLRGNPVSLAGKPESFQTQHAIRSSLERAGFDQINIVRPASRYGRKLWVQASKREADTQEKLLA